MSAPILLVSNGHGEDLSGALIGKELRRRGLEVEALPLVGHGRAYLQAGLPLLGRTREYSTGGLGYTSGSARLKEVLEGQAVYLVRRLLLLFRIAHRYALIVVVGDVIPVVAAWLTRRSVVTYLVAYSSHYEGRLRLPWPCGACLRSRRFRRVFSRDALTARDLSHQLGRPVEFLGNPFFDGALAPSEPLDSPPSASGPGGEAPRQRLGLLPGSRLPEALHNLELMLRSLEQLEARWQSPSRLGIHAALVGKLSGEALAPLAQRLGWRLELGEEDRGWLRRGPLAVGLEWGRFAAVVQQCDLLLAAAGTAAEQAVGLGKPVLQLAGAGPQFTENFAEAQRRLLGPSLSCASGSPGSEQQLRGTAQLVTELLERLEHDPGYHASLVTNGRERIGSPGGTARMAADIRTELLGADPATQPHA